MKLISQGQEVNLPFVSVTDSVYDDEERVVGSWFGKPLYRKCCEVTLSGRGVYVLVPGLQNVDCIIKYYGSAMHIYQTVSGIIINNYGNPSAGLWVCTSTENFVYLAPGVDAYNNKTMKLAIEYTKTTDTIQAATVQEYTTLTSETPINVKFPEGYTISMASATSVASIASTSGCAIL